MKSRQVLQSPFMSQHFASVFENEQLGRVLTRRPLTCVDSVSSPGAKWKQSMLTVSFYGDPREP